jgi:hypothetical protein
VLPSRRRCRRGHPEAYVDRSATPPRHTTAPDRRRRPGDARGATSSRSAPHHCAGRPDATARNADVTARPRARARGRRRPDGKGAAKSRDRQITRDSPHTISLPPARGAPVRRGGPSAGPPALARRRGNSRLILLMGHAMVRPFFKALS